MQNLSFLEASKGGFRGIIKTNQKKAVKKIGIFQGWMRTSYKKQTKKRPSTLSLLPLLFDIFSFILNVKVKF